jgi:outer membrane protein TolC
LARQHNADIRNSRLAVQKAQAVKDQVYTKYFPNVSLRAIGYYAAQPMIDFGVDDISSNDMRELLEAIYEALSDETDVSNRLNLMKKGAGGSLVLAQPIYMGGRIANGNRLADLGVEAAGLQAEMKVRDVLEQVESSYYLVVGLKEKSATVDAALELIDSLSHTVNSALVNGLATKADALQVELKRNEIKAQQQQLNSGIRLARRLLCIQIGIDYSDNLDFGDELRIGNDELTINSQLTMFSSSRPERRLLDINLRAQELQKELTRGEALPQLALVGVGFYGNLIRSNATANAVALLSLTVPLTDWWETSHKIREHNLRIEEARNMQEDYNKKMSLEEEKAYSDMVDAAMLIRSDSAALDLARENYRLATLNYSAGANTLNDVLQAQTLLLQAQNALTDRRIAYLIARRRLQDLTSQSSPKERSR